MKKLIAIISALSIGVVLLVAGCSWFKSTTCTLETQLVNGATPLIATALQCSNSAAITASLNSVVGQTGLCSTTPAAGPVCTVLATAIVGIAASEAIPASWGCTAANAQALLSSAVATACSAVLPALKKP